MRRYRVYAAHRETMLPLPVVDVPWLWLARLIAWAGRLVTRMEFQIDEVRHNDRRKGNRP